MRDLEKLLDIIKALGLEDKAYDVLSDLVKAHVAEVHEFHFEGHRTSCDNDRPHAPHVTSYYPTVRYGNLENYCCGKEGVVEINGRKYYLHIVAKYYRGDAYTPSECGGYWFLRPLEDGEDGD